jgi:hypothetical protein
MDRAELLAEMERLAGAGDEKAFEAFALEHFKEFPEEVQGKILFGFYQETLEKPAGDAITADIQKQGLDALEKIEEIKASVSKPE